MTTSKTTVEIHNAYPLAPLTSWKVGGLAQWYAAPKSLAALEECLTWAERSGEPVTLIGAGSNLLISDRGLTGLVICTRHLRGIEFDLAKGQVTVAAGEPVARLALQVATKGWSGLEWAVGIPGTLGGLVVMNGGAQGGCASDRIINVQTISLGGIAETLLPEELGFAYRTSILQAGDRIVTAATLQLNTGFDPQVITATTNDFLRFRHRMQPYHLPSCGSVFRNPHPHAAARLIEDTGLKGYRIGDAQVSELHANFIVNCGHASSTDIIKLIRHVQTQVAQKWAINLETEVKMLGEF
ncbi:UDP-N-acetylmuramate dehydrogenase [Synechococcus sp. PCC 7502]|uniref:UDP-N-acetylmuramate dehydrogenase n=1 Tax=Synechococcus sp. PCC 7502 TaxID=1173263 RepID=UPI0002D4C520|nr:UDP-N-acetylmuramate dehydrogenase [Synechococcus sp. PCC 7502]